MKYVKLFEAFIREAAGSEVKVDSFNRSEPQEYPVVKTTIGDIYPGGKLDGKAFPWVLSRAYQEKSTKENPNPKFRTATPYKVYGPDYVRLNQYDSGNIKLSSNEVFRVTKSDKRDALGRELKAGGIPNPFAEQFAVFRGYAKGRPGSVKDIDFGSGEFVSLDSIFGTQYRSGLIILIPSDIKKAGISNLSSKPIRFLPCIAIAKNTPYITNVGNALSYIYTGDTDAFLQSEEQTSAALAAIFAGETGDRKLAYDNTLPPVNIGNARFLASTTEGSKDKIEDPMIVTTSKGSEYVGQIRFEFDKADLTEAAKETLDSEKLRARLLVARKSIEIVGNADGSGTDKRNKELSEQRAASVLNYLKTTDWWDLVAERLKDNVKTLGVGSSKPIMNDDKGKEPVAATANRRVDFIIDGATPNYTNLIKQLEEIKKGKSE